MSDSPAGAGVGVRATVRYRLEPAPAAGAPHLSDVVGTVVANGPAEIVLDTRRGRVRIARRLVVATRVIPAVRPRRGVVGGELAPLALHDRVAGAWPAMETERLGGWLLRASRGFTARGNSVVPVGDPGMPLDSAVTAIETWYAVRALPSNLTLTDPHPGTTAAGAVTVDVRRDPLGALLLDRGYALSDPSLFLTAWLDEVRAALARVARHPLDGVVVQTGSELTQGWLTAYDGYRVGDRAALEAILTGTPVRSFALARDGERIVGVGRLGVTGDWGGVAAMWVESAYRRRGVADAMFAALADDAAAAGVVALHLQVWAHNAPAIALYERLGFGRHHAYVNATRPLPVERPVQGRRKATPTPDGEWPVCGQPGG